MTIGAHGDTHINLARASAATVHREMTSNRRFLEEHHRQAGAAFRLSVRQCARLRRSRSGDSRSAVGFRTAVTTRSGAIFPEHLDHPHALPREVLSADDTPASLRCKLDGVYRAFHSRLGDPIARM